MNTRLLQQHNYMGKAFSEYKLADVNERTTRLMPSNWTYYPDSGTSYCSFVTCEIDSVVLAHLLHHESKGSSAEQRRLITKQNLLFQASTLFEVHTGYGCGAQYCSRCQKIDYKYNYSILPSHWKNFKEMLVQNGKDNSWITVNTVLYLKIAASNFGKEAHAYRESEKKATYKILLYPFKDHDEELAALMTQEPYPVLPHALDHSTEFASLTVLWARISKMEKSQQERILLSKNGEHKNIYHIIAQKHNFSAFDDLNRVFGINIFRKAMFQKTKLGDTPLHLSAFSIEKVKFILTNLTPEQQNELIMQRNKENQTSIHLACLFGQREIVNILIANITPMSLYHLRHSHPPLNDSQLPVNELSVIFNQNNSIFNLLDYHIKNKDRHDDEILKRREDTTRRMNLFARGEPQFAPDTQFAATKKFLGLWTSSHEFYDLCSAVVKFGKVNEYKECMQLLNDVERDPQLRKLLNLSDQDVSHIHSIFDSKRERELDVDKTMTSQEFKLLTDGEKVEVIELRPKSELKEQKRLPERGNGAGLSAQSFLASSQASKRPLAIADSADKVPKQMLASISSVA